jgi:hypothetical protein
MRQLVTIAVTSAALTLAFAAAPPSSDAKEYGACNFASDCHAGVKCNGGRCADSAGSKCGFDSDCGGAKCNSGKCASAPDGKCNFTSDCGHGGKCNSGRCTY